MTGGEIMKLKRKGVDTMLAKIEFATYMAYWKIRRRLMEMANEEDGMETLETIIIIGIVVLLAAMIYEKLLGKDGRNGMVGGIFNNIDEKFSEMFK